MKNIAIVGILALAIIVSGCAYGGSQSNSADIPPNTVIIKDFAFNPATLTVNIGTTVTWSNEDTAVHRIKSSTFESTELKTGESFTYTFEQQGQYEYSCAIHPSMKGTIVVQ